MKTIILAGGKGTRISEESFLKPKPMIEIGEYPILVHIMMIYASQGYKNFGICAGYKQRCIKEYFANFGLYTHDVTFNLSTGAKQLLEPTKFDWNVSVFDTGIKTETGGRIKRVRDFIAAEPFFLTYGDAVGDIDIESVLSAHKAAKKMATICVYNFAQNKGVVQVDKDGGVLSFQEKAKAEKDLINIGFMVCEPSVLDFIDGDGCVFERDVLPRLATMGQLNSYLHKGFWQCMDTMREKDLLEQMEDSGNCPWKVWDK